MAIAPGNTQPETVISYYLNWK